VGLKPGVGAGSAPRESAASSANESHPAFIPILSSMPLATLIYDPHCGRCARFAQWCRHWSQEQLAIAGYDEPGVMDSHPKLSFPQVQKAPHLILANGYLCRGAEAVAFALSLRPGFGFIAVLFHLPLFRQLGWLLYWIFKARPKACENCP
jgi:hypothetical protein